MSESDPNLAADERYLQYLREKETHLIRGIRNLTNEISKTDRLKVQVQQDTACKDITSRAQKYDAENRKKVVEGDQEKRPGLEERKAGRSIALARVRGLINTTVARMRLEKDAELRAKQESATAECANKVKSVEEDATKNIATVGLPYQRTSRSITSQDCNKLLIPAVVKADTCIQAAVKKAEGGGLEIVSSAGVLPSRGRIITFTPSPAEQQEVAEAAVGKTQAAEMQGSEALPGDDGWVEVSAPESSEDWIIVN